MKKINKNTVLHKWKPYFLCGVLMLFLSNIHIYAQENPPRPILVNMLQDLSFGAFSQDNSGGTVIIDATGFRTYTGDIVLLNMGYSYFSAIFEIDANKGTVISILNGPDIFLVDGSGHSMKFHIDAAIPASPFTTTVSPPVKTQVSIGGTLTVGSPLSNPAGTYIGTFSITFNQE